MTTPTIFHVKGTRGARAIWLCEELGLPYRVEVIDFSPAYRTSAEWRSKSPTGKVPVMVHGDLTMFESGAMVDFLLERYGEGRLAPEPGTSASALCRQWSWFAEATFARPLGEIVNHNRVAPEGGLVDFVIEDCKDRARICIAAIEEALAESSYLVGDAFTYADIMTGYSLLLASNFGVLTDDYPRTLAYYNRLSERPGFQVARDAG
ncbi:MAG: glutathione S-transferase family protein [Gammaproteobacteria bacterium]|nr:glutathione S-transferase family protein [Gammaproteobacteria bacterium]